ncbi:MAG: hypothetical protein H6702_06215 [Myxococcales bacterium]|nr:hypothetical protein [Myxococcales bacterium]
MIPALSAALFALGGLAAAAAWPLATYAVALAALGAPHVFAELRVVGLRYGPGATRPILAAVGLGLAALAVARAGSAWGWWGPARTLQLALAVGLAAVALPALWRRSVGHAAVGAALITAVAWGAALAPVETLLLLAVTHNLTPLGFLADGAPRRVQAWALLIFIGGPLLLASGLPYRALDALGWAALEANPLPAGPLAAHLGAFLPAGLRATPHAVHLFAAVAFAQLMHHGAVLAVLPRLAPPAGRWVWPALGAVGALSLLGFARDFAGARQAYGIIAAVHAWVELPVLLLILAGSGERAPWRAAISRERAVPAAPAR